MIATQAAKGDPQNDVIATAIKQPSAGTRAHVCFARDARAELTIAVATFRVPTRLVGAMTGPLLRVRPGPASS